MMSRIDSSSAISANPIIQTRWLIDCWLFCLVVIAAYIRISGAGAFHLNSDEILYLRMAEGKNLQEVIRFSLNETHPPLHYILLHYWTVLFGLTDNALRCFSLLFGLFLIPLYYRIGNYLAGQLAGMCCAMLVAGSYALIIQSYLAREYTTFLFFLSLTFACHLRWHDTRSNKSLYAYAAFGILACMTDFPGMVALFCIGSAEMLFLQINAAPVAVKARWVLTHIAMASIALFIYWFWLPTIGNVELGIKFSHLHPSAFLIIHGLLTPFFMPAYLLPFRQDSFYLIAFYPILAICIWQASQLRSIGFFVCLMIGVLLLGSLLFALGSYSVRGMTGAFAGRHDLWMLPFVLTPVGIGAAILITPWAKTKWPRRIVAGILLILPLALYDADLRFADSEYMLHTQSYEEAKDYLQRLDGNNTIIANRIGGFIFGPKNFNPFEYMNRSQWQDKELFKIVPYGGTNMVFGTFIPSSYGYNDFKTLVEKAYEKGKLSERLVFIKTRWSSQLEEDFLIHTADCPGSNATLLHYPAELPLKRAEVILLQVPRDVVLKEIRQGFDCKS